MAELKAITVRLPIALHDRLERAVARANEVDMESTVTKATWALVAIQWALDQDEAAAIHVPLAVSHAMPRMSGRRIIMPRGRVMPSKL